MMNFGSNKSISMEDSSRSEEAWGGIKSIDLLQIDVKIFDMEMQELPANQPPKCNLL